MAWAPSFKNRRQHEVLDADWDVSPVTKQNKDRAWSQLGTSGSGNHFVEFGLFTAHGKIHGLEPGTYLALLSHSGSRGTGAAVCDHYSKLAFSQFPDLPSELKRLAWLSLDSAGRPGILGGDGVDGPLRRGQPRPHPQARGRQSRGRGPAGPGEPSQLRLERAARDQRRRKGSHRSPQGRDPGRPGCAGHHSRARWPRRALSSAAKATRNR